MPDQLDRIEALRAQLVALRQQMAAKPVPSLDLRLHILSLDQQLRELEETARRCDPCCGSARRSR